MCQFLYLDLRVQGAKIAIEDTVVLSALWYVSSLSQVPALLRAYHDIACAPVPLLSPPFIHKATHSSLKVLPHAAATQESYRLDRKDFRLLDRPEQCA
jgi:hypothetical protein